MITLSTCTRCNSTGIRPLKEIAESLRVAATLPEKRCREVCLAACSHLRCHAETCEKALLRAAQAIGPKDHGN